MRTASGQVLTPTPRPIIDNRCGETKNKSILGYCFRSKLINMRGSSFLIRFAQTHRPGPRSASWGGRWGRGARDARAGICARPLAGSDCARARLWPSASKSFATFTPTAVTLSSYSTRSIRPCGAGNPRRSRRCTALGQVCTDALG